MFLAFPLDFQKDLFIRAAVAPYGQLLEWYGDSNKSRILVQVLLLSPDRVPRSIIVSRGTQIGATGRSWAVPVYILNGRFPDVFPADEDPVAFDGEPHPEHPLIVIGHQAQEPNWEDEQNGVAPNIRVFGGNPHPQPGPNNAPQQAGQNAQNAEDNNMQDDDMDVDEEMEAPDDDPWPEWNPAVFVANNQQEQVPQHPNLPQPNLPPHLMDLDLSSSTMSFLRASGPDIPLEDVFQDLQSDSGSSTSSDASSVQVEDHARFLAARSHCATISLFHRKGIPSASLPNLGGPTQRSSFAIRPIIIENP